MNKQYLKQAWNLMRFEKLFSSIYIIGTGLSITIVMVLSIVFYIKIAGIYPETNRDRLLVVKSGMEKYGERGWSASSLSWKTIESCFTNLEGAETVTSLYRNRGDNYVQAEGSNEQLPVTVKYVDTQFWAVFPFRFMEGKPFTEADFQSGIATAVIAESLAKQLFGAEEAVGREVSLDFRPYRVCGVVKDASFITDRVYGQLYIPYSIFTDYKEHAFGMHGTLGNLEAYILANSPEEVEKVRQAANENVGKYAHMLEGSEFSVVGQPDRQWQSIFRMGGNHSPDFTKLLWQYGIIFLLLLLVPAVSLSGMTESRMERRMAEMGVRRAFGAPVGTLMRQVISENFFFTFLGGMAGLLFSYLIVFLGRNWIMQIGLSYGTVPPEGVNVSLSPSMLLNFPVFGLALGVCLALNLLSSLIPAWRASRKEIVYSLNDK